MIAVPAEIVLNLPVWDLSARGPGAATAAGIAVAVLAGAVGGVVPGLAAAAAGWSLNLLYVADEALDGLLALPAWLVAGVAAGWLAAHSQRRARESRLAEARLAAVRDAASEAILAVDLHGTITSSSPAAQALYGYRESELVGRPLDDLLAGPDPGEQATRLLEALSRGERSDELVEQTGRDGQVFTAAVSLIPTSARGGRPDGGLVVARDVGELRRVASRLRDVEARYRALTEQLPVATYLRSLAGDGETTFVSPQIHRLVGYTAEEWLADPELFLRLVHPEDRDRVAAERARLPARDRVASGYRMLSRDGRVVSVWEEAVVVRDDEGRPRHVQGYLLDVSERAELRTAQAAAAAEARDRQRRLELVAEAASVLASSLDFRSTVAEVARLIAREAADWCIVDLLDEDGALTRLAAERAEPGASRGEPEPRPDAAAVDVLRARVPELSESRLVLPLVSRGGRAVGLLTLLADANARRFAPDDVSWAQAVGKMVALAIDNSRLHDEVEARSDANKVLTHVGDGVVLLDRGGVIRLWNPAAAAITGVAAEAVLGKPASDAFRGWQKLSERIPVGTTSDLAAPEALPLETGRGERWISISGVEFSGGTVYAFRDITEAHRLDELKAEFIATASHELRTPLAAVYGAAQTLRRHDFALDEAGRERFISLIVDESDRLARIVNQILLANQLEVGRVDLETEPFDAVELIERVVEAARTHAPAHVTFHVAVGEGVPPVAADKDRVRQVLVNLVDNAVKYSPGGGRVELGAEAAAGVVRFRVADEGVGIPADERQRIFEKFYRLDPDMTHGVGGTGLGLYICSELVERMGGRIWVESADEKGSVFFFELPTTGSPRVPARDRKDAEPRVHLDVGG